MKYIQRWNCLEGKHTYKGNGFLPGKILHPSLFSLKVLSFCWQLNLLIVYLNAYLILRAFSYGPQNHWFEYKLWAPTASPNVLAARTVSENSDLVQWLTDLQSRVQFPCGESSPLHRKNNSVSNKKTTIVSGNLQEPPKLPTDMSKGNWVREHPLGRSNRFRQMGEGVHSSILAKDESHSW